MLFMANPFCMDREALMCTIAFSFFVCIRHKRSRKSTQLANFATKKTLVQGLKSDFQKITQKN